MKPVQHIDVDRVASQVCRLLAETPIGTRITVIRGGWLLVEGPEDPPLSGSDRVSGLATFVTTTVPPTRADVLARLRIAGQRESA